LKHGNIGGRVRALPRRITAGALAACLLSVGLSAPAQDRGRQPAHKQRARLELGAYGGYSMGGSAEAVSTLNSVRADIQSAPSYGATLDLGLRPGMYLEASYSRQDTEIELVSSAIGYESTRARYDFLVQYIQLGGLMEFRVPNVEWLRPTFGGTLGATVYSASQEESGYAYEEWRPSILLEAGAKILIGNHLGIRLRARLLSTLITEDSAMFCGNISGCTLLVAGQGVFQGEFGAGAYVAF
jgi:hypothetical protein